MAETLRELVVALSPELKRSKSRPRRLRMRRRMVLPGGQSDLAAAWRMKEIDEMDMLGFLRLQTWDATREQEKKNLVMLSLTRYRTR